MATYLEAPPEAVDDDERTLVLSAVKYGAAAAELPWRPAVRWFWSSSSPDKATRWPLGSFEHATKPRAVLTGRAEPHPSTLWLREGLDRRHILPTLFHELKHLAQLGSDEVRDEREAERWGQELAHEFETRPRGIKSALDLEIRTADVDDWGDVLTTSPAAGLRQTTDLGEGMWESRPLVIDGWGLKAERIGTVTSLEAGNEMLWAEAQLAKHHRYREYIAKLIEQGSMKADAMTLSRLAEWSGPRLARLPIVGIQLSPQGIAA